MIDLMLEGSGGQAALDLLVLLAVAIEIRGERDIGGDPQASRRARSAGRPHHRRVAHRRRLVRIIELVAADPDSTSALPGNTGLIALDLRVTPELAAEGTARDVVRIVQQARRDAGLAVSDRIRLDIGAEILELACVLTDISLQREDADARP